jgi:hypothetical protein
MGVTLATGPAYASTPVNVSHASVTCNSVVGTIAFNPALKLSGPTTGSDTITLKVALSGCTSPQVNAGGSIFTGAISGTIVGSAGSNCTGLSGLSSVTANPLIKWKAPTGYSFTPTANSNLGISQTQGGTYSVTGQTPWAGGYGQFEVGATYGTAATSVTGAFAGTDSGATSWFNGTTGQDTVSLLASCLSSTGLKLANFGIGGVSLA